MSNFLGLDRLAVEKAVRQYYQDYENELYKKFDFDSFAMYVDGKNHGYLEVEYIVKEREPLPPPTPTEGKTDE